MPSPASSCGCLVRPPVAPTLAENCGSTAIFVFMAIVEKYIRSQCDIDDPCGRATPRFRSDPDETYDFIVVGGGVAGSVVASRLTEETNWKVLLIEAGDDEPAASQVPSMLTYFDTELDWNYKTEPEKNACLNNGGVCKLPSGKALGGTAAFNGMMYIRGNPEDYDYWASLGNPGWSYNELKPLFLYSEDNLQINTLDKNYHSAGGLLHLSQFPNHPPLAESILEGGKELGYYVQDLNARNTTGFMIAQTLSKSGVRYSTARAFLRPARDRENLHILLKTMVARVLVEPKSKTVYGVEIIDSKTGKRRKIHSTKEVVVSGGAVNSPQILLLSGIGPEKDLQEVDITPVHNLPGVGQNLMNHVSYTVHFELDEKDTVLLNLETVKDYIKNRKGLMAGTGLGQLTAKFVSPYAKAPSVPDSQLFFGGYLASCSKTGLVGALQSNGSRRFSVSPTAVQAKSKGYLSLASNNPLDRPRIVPNYLTEDYDVKVLLNGIKLAKALSETAALKKLGTKLVRTPVKGCEKLTFDSDEYWKCAIRRDTAPENHQAGSCKMGPKTDPKAVVDSELKVHGISRLRIMDTSIMPELTSGNTMAPCIVIAEKGVLSIKNYWLIDGHQQKNKQHQCKS